MAPEGAFFQFNAHYALNELPQPQLDVAFGFLITNCAPSNPSL